MRLLITGGAGYIGSHVVLAALEKKYKVTIFDNLSSGSKKNINPNAEFILGSIMSNEDLSNLFSQGRYDGVIHLAASKSAGDSMIDPINYAENNILGSMKLLNKCVKQGINFFIFSSTAAVYGSPIYLPIDELHVEKPSNYYGYTKLTIERNLKWYSKLKGLKFASLRYFNVAGYDIKKRIFQLEKEPCNLIPIIMETAIGKRSKLSIFGNNYDTKDGTGVRDYIHVSDIAKAHIKSFEYLYEKKKNLIINLGSERGYSVLNILSVVKDITNIKINYDIKGPRKGDVPELIASCSLAKENIGWNQDNSKIETIISSVWNIYKEQY